MISIWKEYPKDNKIFFHKFTNKKYKKNSCGLRISIGSTRIGITITWTNKNGRY